MSEFKVNLKTARREVDAYEKLVWELDNLQDVLSNTRRSLSFEIAQKERVQKRLEQQEARLFQEKGDMMRLSVCLDKVLQQYEKTEMDLCGLKTRNIAREEFVSKEKSKWENFIDEFKSNYGWKEILKGSNYIGKIYNFIDDIKNGKSWLDFADVGMDIYEFIDGAAKTYNDYKLIGNAVGTKTAMGWWFKNITGIKSLGRASTAKNIVTRFKNNLTNKTSPFNAKFKDIVGNFSGKNGVGKAAASWGSVAIDGVLNWFSNKEEQANSNGKMSDGRVVAETISETVLDTALSYGAGIVVGAAVTTVMGTVAAPAVVVTAIGGLAIAGINAGVKALTGQTATEWVSDAILDAGEAIGEAVGNAAKKAKETVGSWFKKLGFT